MPDGINNEDKRMDNGFSLIEMMIVVAIVGILASLTYPGYRDYITRAHRVDGQTALLDLANRMERYYFDNNTYQTATVNSGEITDVLSNNLSPAGWYTLSIIKATDSAYTLKATPTYLQATNDTRCQSLTFNNTGVKNVTSGPAGAPSGTAAQCW